MSTCQTKNRKNGFITALAAAAALTTLGLAGAPNAMANLAENMWSAASGGAMVGGTWGTAANWSANRVPGSNGGYTDYTMIDNTNPAGSNTNGFTVTVSSNYSSYGPNIGTVSLNAPYGYNVQGSDSSPVAMDVTAGGYLATGGGVGVGGAGSYGATLNVDAGGTVKAAQVFIGNGFAGSQAPSVFNITGTVYLTTGGNNTGLGVGNQDNGTVNLSEAGLIAPSANTPLEFGLGTIGGTGPLAGTGGEGTMNQSGGTVTMNGDLDVGMNSVGVYNFQNGAINGGGNVRVGDGAQGTFTMTGGNLTTGANNQTQLFIGTNGTNATNGLFSISGGTVATTGGLVGPPMLQVGSGNGLGSGELRVTGSGSSITLLAGTAQPTMVTYSNSTLDFQIGSTGVSTIYANDSESGYTNGTLNTATDNRDAAGLSGILQIDLLNGFTPVDGTIYTLISSNVVLDPTTAGYSGIVDTAGTQINYYGFTYTDTGLSLASADAGLWELLPVTVNSAGTATLLQVEYIGQTSIPEPATLGFMAMGGLGILLLGRKRKPA